MPVTVVNLPLPLSEAKLLALIERIESQLVAINRKRLRSYERLLARPHDKRAGAAYANDVSEECWLAWHWTVYIETFRNHFGGKVRTDPRAPATLQLRVAS